MKPANYAPVYAGLYPELAEIARKHGYAMAVHGSFARDADLICIPWTNDASEPQAVVDGITSEFAVRSLGEPSTREHGRIVYTLTVAAPGCFIDLSFTPRAALADSVPTDVAELVVAARLVAFEDQSPEAIKRLDTASEAFADRVPWDDEPASRALSSAPAVEGK